ncbi:unnamed protein product [Prorocentrum cordatum]|uniref:Uncharacterized protein n=1 Tax=Prorocentrum cordatum TaxID=2364126 RepID=A0ABN9VLR3_9DINO|nr:unnamed protein product [Polarella glacialis]
MTPPSLEPPDSSELSCKVSSSASQPTTSDSSRVGSALPPSSSTLVSAATDSATFTSVESAPQADLRKRGVPLRRRAPESCATLSTCSAISPFSSVCSSPGSALWPPLPPFLRYAVCSDTNPSSLATSTRTSPPADAAAPKMPLIASVASVVVVVAALVRQHSKLTQNGLLPLLVQRPRTGISEGRPPAPGRRLATRHLPLVANALDLRLHALHALGPHPQGQLGRGCRGSLLGCR